LVATNWLQKACTETVYTVERETGLEPATACLEGRCSQYRRLLDTNSHYRLIEQCSPVLTHA
jgi:hypothetical protein